MTDAGSTTLSRATNGELSEVLALLRSAELLETGVAEAVDAFLVARSGGALLGTAGLEAYGDFGLLRSVAVAAEARGHGLGRQLVAGIVADAERRGLRELYLLTTTAPLFFERLGFRAIARGSVPEPVAGSWEFRVGCPQSARAMRLVLTSESEG